MVGVGDADVASLHIVECGLHLGTVQVITHLHDVVMSRFIDHSSSAVDYREAQIIGQYAQNVLIVHRVVL